MNEVRFSRQVKEVKFGAWSLDPRKQSISDGCVERELEPLLFRLLCYFIINNDQIITRQDLVDDVWCQKYVDDNAINRAMSELRKLLKSELQQGIVVKTHYRKGYSFFLEPEIIYHSEQAQEGTVAVAPQPAQKDPAPISSHSVQPKRTKRNVFLYPVVFFVSLLSMVVGYIVTATDSAYESQLTVHRDIEEHVVSWVPGLYAQLKLSFDKKRLAFVFVPQGAKYTSLVVKDLASGYERRLGEEGVNYYPLGWSTDSSILYYRTKTDDSCQIWQINADFSEGNKTLFDCSMRGLVSGSGVGKNRLVYSKAGYRNRDELAALTSRDLKTGEEFQISSPNLNSYGDQFLSYIPEKEVILFERRQYDTNELYMTDLDGGNQVKLLESPGRIWSLNYDSESDLLLWFDNRQNIAFGYSLSERRLVKKEKLNTPNDFAIFQFLNQDEMLIVSYPYTDHMLALGLGNQEKKTDILLNMGSLSLGSLSPIKVKQDYLIVTTGADGMVVAQVDGDGNQRTLGVPPGDIRNIRYHAESDLLLVRYHRKVEVYKYADLSLVDSISEGGAVISAEFLSGDDIGYVVLDEHKVKSSSYQYSLRHKKKALIPALNALWIGRLDETTLVSLSSNDTVFMYDINSGDTLEEIDLPDARFRHSIAAGGGYIYHSDGKRIYRTARGKNGVLEEIYRADNAKYLIKGIQYSSQDDALWLYVTEINENQILQIKLGDESKLQ
ncbi:winged helix-turn-helix domain-containing protein [Pseudoalteromonas viridis]|uniref:Winged helix-turn-helix domain-containing protein n=1 Tax=Pseudoalteromonas viridis TaxID=339617 RepID=A0ABX7VCR7_9GAMM|nr:winged helix-turn-helix domain-containing protein [Pseudoalteromonas viridis]QTL36468.1 winged helix-turn-helix domain-containing protein [Pseudoalteromonas viridis]